MFLSVNLFLKYEDLSEYIGILFLDFVTCGIYTKVIIYIYMCALSSYICRF